MGNHRPKITSGDMDKNEYAIVNDSNGFREYVYGTYIEIEDYCSDYGLRVDKYLKSIELEAQEVGCRDVGFKTGNV